MEVTDTQRFMQNALPKIRQGILHNLLIHSCFHSTDCRAASQKASKSVLPADGGDVLKV